MYEDIRNYISLQGVPTPSDINLKENITESQLNTDKLLNLSIKDFNYKADKTKTRYTGLIAQELKLQLPELVFGKEGHYSIDYIKMVPYLLKVLQQQQKEIFDLKRERLSTASGAAGPDIVRQVQHLQQQLLQQQLAIKVLQARRKNGYGIQSKFLCQRN